MKRKYFYLANTHLDIQYPTMVIAETKEKAWEKLEKYWNEYSNEMPFNRAVKHYSFTVSKIKLEIPFNY
mgnify:FL=1